MDEAVIEVKRKIMAEAELEEKNEARNDTIEKPKKD